MPTSTRTPRRGRRRLALLAALSLAVTTVTVAVAQPSVAGSSVETPATRSAAAAAVAPNLLGHWTFDEGTGTSAADSAGSHPATLTGGAAWTGGLQGPSALAVNGTSAVADTGAAVLDTSTSFSVVTSVKLVNLNGFQTVVSQDGNQVSGFFLGLRGDSGKFAFVRLPGDAGSSPAAFPSSLTAPVAGQWYQLAGVYDADRSTLSLYVNGQLQQTTAAPSGWAATGHLVIGRGKYGANPVDFVNGAIDDVRAYSGALSPAAVAQLSLAGGWRLDEGTGTVAADDSENHADGTLSAGATWTTGVVGTHAVLFNGTSGAIETQKPVFDSSRSFSVSAWARVDAADGFRTIASVDGTNISGFYLQRRNDGKWAFARLAGDTTGDPAATVVESTTPAVVGSWTQILGVYDSVGKTITLYVNGVTQGSAAYTTGWNATGHFVIGRGRYYGGPVDFFAGAIDDVHAYPVALDATAAQALATSGRWHFDEGSGTVAVDSSASGANGTLRGATWTPGVSGSAIALGGSADVTMGAAPALDLGTGSSSVSAWLKTGSTGVQPVVQKGAVAAADTGYRIGVAAGKVTARLGGGATRVDIATTAGGFADSTWHNTVMVTDRTAQRLTLYVDGIAQPVVTTTGTCGTVTGNAVDISGCAAASADSTADFTVGSTSGAAPRFTGAIDEVTVLRSPLTAQQVSIAAGISSLSVNAADQRSLTHSTQYGAILEDISHSVEGGVYAELVRNRSFGESYESGSGAGDGPVPYWSLAVSGGATGTFAIDTKTPLNTAITRSLDVHVGTLPAGGQISLNDVGYYGVEVSPSTKYTGSLFAKASAGFTGRIRVSLTKSDGTVIVSKVVGAPTTAWGQYGYTLSTAANTGTSTDNFVTVSLENSCSGRKCAAISGKDVWLSTVSLFPPTYKNRPNGLRTDIMTQFAAMHLGLLRVPGGNYLEGNTLDTRFNWEKTVGPISQRPGHQNTAWGYWSSDGMGILEYLQMAEDLGAQPLLAVYAGYNLNGTHVSEADYPQYVQSALDEIQYAIGDPSTTWGAKRAADGHPAPFKLTYVEIGNEDFFDNSGSYEWRFADMYDAIKAAYPQLQLIATTPVSSRTPDVVDDHYYQSPQWFNDNSGKYDTLNRSGPKVLVGEYGSLEGSPTGDLAAAVGEAAFLTGLERNSDVIVGGMYAPILVNENQSNWPTNMIGLDAGSSYGSPSYWVQTMFSNNLGKVVLGSSLSQGSALKQVVTSTTTGGRTTFYVKVVNPSSQLQSARITIVNVASLDGTYTRTVLTGDPAARNTLAGPTTVVPVTTGVSGLTNGKLLTFPANSVTVLKITGK
ncbi:alpha-L-arabinofuranosidase [Nakamurella sp. UYEF19]|uniref:LamG-like jellyroll fold domain-containing protein n=1 Tax=Nakamurella sp. UYEF19 TaxID=1756392 RepID=UPI00339A5D0A